RFHTKLMVIKMNVTKKENLQNIIKYLTPEIVTALENLSGSQIEDLCEIRIREEQPVIFIFGSSFCFITLSGRLTQFFSENLLKVRKADVERIFSQMCRYSVYSLTQSIACGFISLEGGNRVGVYGTAVSENGKVVSVRNISGLNIRFSGEFKNISRPIAEKFFCREISNTLVCGPPASGKTTVIRDLCRILSDEKLKKIAVIDERSEMYGYNLGFNTDLLNCYPKASGIEIAVRTLSPDIIICDEIGEADELKAIINSLNSGVKFIMSIHCSNFDQLKRKEQFKILESAGAVENYVFLDRNFRIEMRRKSENNSVGVTGDFLRSDRAVHSIHA
ncbi:MAG: hypothetical protein KBT46_08465, partial [Ruminococcus sp.]|nr:hypothetical protein [Candidatus Copronaster equi]